MDNTPQPGFTPRQGLGEPSAIPVDVVNNRPMRNGFTFQTRFAITGHCVFLGAFFESQTLPMPTFAKIVCSPPVPSTPPTPPSGIVYQQLFSGIGPPTITPKASTAIYSDVTNPAQPAFYLWNGGVWTEFIG
jgi:hypothetical protein